MREMSSPFGGFRSPFGQRSGIWILITGLWANNGFWVDTQTWNDGV